MNLTPIRLFLLNAARKGVAKVLGTILCVGGTGFGVALVSERAFVNYKLFAVNWEFASPSAWGTAFIVASLVLGVSVWVETAYGSLPSLILGAMFILFGLLTLATGASSGVWLFVTLGWVAIFTQVVCWAEEGHARRRILLRVE